jgi:hypothetical protein
MESGIGRAGELRNRAPSACDLPLRPCPLLLTPLLPPAGISAAMLSCGRGGDKKQRQRTTTSVRSYRPASDNDPGASQQLPTVPTPRANSPQSAAAASGMVASRAPPEKEAVRSLWSRQHLSSTWGEDKAFYCGMRGRVTQLDRIGNQVEIEFASEGDQQPVRRLVYPIDAVGIPVQGESAQPLQSGDKLLELGDDLVVQQIVEVRDDVDFVQQCFTGHNIPFAEEFGTDMQAFVQCGGSIGVALLLGWVADIAGSWVHCVSLLACMVLAYNAIYQERICGRKIELLSERRCQQQRERDAPEEETVEWVNGVLWKAWSPMQKTIATHLHKNLQYTLDEYVTEPYVSEIEIGMVNLGHQPPIVRTASFADSDVYGEFKINSKVMLIAPEARVAARVVLSFRGVKLEVPIQLHDVVAGCDVQLILRGSDTQGLTMVGVMLNDRLELDYRLTLFNGLELTAFPMVLRYVNHAINDSVWWMRKPNKLDIPWIPGAEFDKELSRSKRNIGQLEIHVVEAIGASSESKPEPYVKVSLFQRGSEQPARYQYQTKPASNKLQRPMWAHENWTYLHADEVQNGFLLFQVYSSELPFDVLIGCAEVNLHTLLSDPRHLGKVDEWLVLTKQEGSPGRSSPRSPRSPVTSESFLAAEADDGIRSHDEDQSRLHVQIRFHRKLQQKTASMGIDAQVIQKGEVETGVLEVKVLQCKRLVATSGSKDDPCVEIQIGGERERTPKIKAHCFPTWTQDNRFEFSVKDLSKLVIINVLDAAKKKCIGCLLNKSPQDRDDFPTVPQFLDMVGLLQDGQVKLMDTANKWLPLCDAQSGKPTSQELRVEVAFRACKTFSPASDTVLVGKIPKRWTVGDRFNPEVVIKQALDKSVGAVHSSYKVLGVYVCRDSGKRKPEPETEPEPELQPESEAWYDDGSMRAAMAPRELSDVSTEVTWALVVFSNNESASAALDLATVTATASVPRATQDEVVDLEIRRAMPRDPKIFEKLSINTTVFDRYWRRYIREHRREGILVIRLNRCTDLLAADSNGFSDPYVVLRLGNSGLLKSSVCSKTLNPCWKENFVFNLQAPSRHDQENLTLYLEVFDHDRLHKDTPLGMLSVNLLDVFSEGWQLTSRKWYDLQDVSGSPDGDTPDIRLFPKKNGTIELNFRFVRDVKKMDVKDLSETAAHAHRILSTAQPADKFWIRFNSHNIASKSGKGRRRVRFIRLGPTLTGKIGLYAQDLNDNETQKVFDLERIIDIEPC